MGWISNASGVELDWPEQGSCRISISTAVKGGRNASDNTLIVQEVGNDKLRIDYSIPFSTPAEARRYLLIWDRLQGGKYIDTWRVPDPRSSTGWSYLEMYVSDREIEPDDVDPQTGQPRVWKGLKFSLVEV